MYATDIFNFFPQGTWKKGNYAVKLVEDIILFISLMVQAKTRTQYSLAIVTFIKARTDGPLVTAQDYARIMMYLEQLFGKEHIQGPSSPFQPLRDILRSYETVRNLPICTKFYKFIMYCLSLNLLEGAGITFDNLRYSPLEAEAVRRQYHKGPDFIFCMLDTILFLCETGYQCLKTKTLDPIYHTGSAYEDWFQKTQEKIRLSNFLSNPEPHGFNRFSYLSELNHLIEQGEAILKYTLGKDQMMKTIVERALNSMKMIRSTELTRKAAQQERKAPFSVLLYGGSSIAKSTLTKILFYQYGKLFNLPTTSEYKYTRNPVDQFWSNFNSTQWCVQLDDIAFMHPNVASNGDPSLMEMLQVINNVPFVPTQAAIEDKGKTPLLSRFVIATTNTEHLNSQFYFSCPLAVLRRLPYVIDVQPKPEYTKDGCMLDSTKVPKPSEGDYPDYWTFVVKRVIPVGKNRERQRAAHETIGRFDNIYDFLDWFSETAIEYEGVQNKVSECDLSMSKVELCACHRPKSHCKCQVQASEVEYFGPPNGADVETPPPHISEEELETTWVRLMARKYLKTGSMVKEVIREVAVDTFHQESWIDLYAILVNIFACWLHFKIPLVARVDNFFWGKWWWIWPTWALLGRAHIMKRCMFRFGESVKRRIGVNRFLAGVAAATLTAVGFYKAYRCMTKVSDLVEVQAGDTLTQFDIIDPIAPPEEAREESEAKEAMIPSGRPPQAEDIGERTNVWYKDDYQTTSFDVSVETTSMKGLEKTQIYNMLKPNMVMIALTVPNTNPPRCRLGKMFCVGGHLYVVNSHTIPDCDEPITMVLYEQAKKDGVTTNIQFTMTKSDIVRFPNSDVAFMRIRNTAPKKRFDALFCKSSLKGVHQGVLLGREFQGDVSIRRIRNVMSVVMDIGLLHLSGVDVWSGILNPGEKETTYGDCGSILLSEEPNGPVILGIHVLGNGRMVGSLSVTQDLIERARLHFGEPIIQSGTPLLSAPSAQRELVELHKKSTIRYMRSGCAKVYGSFGGFRPKGKSSVQPSLLMKAMMMRGYKLKFAAPYMAGWEPFYVALVDMVRPVTKMNTHILSEIVKTFTQDILDNLSDKDLEKVHTYDYETAINGANGVSFVDKLNRNTSAGNPWKKSKKFFMRALPSTATVLDPVEFDEEIMDRVKICEQRYLKGERYHPVFCAHLKDDPMSFKKVKAKATRVFTGAPVDWCIVNRKYLLSVIRLIQNNRFTFESGPGTIAQSLEWEEIYDYITKFGKHKIVAGDYSKFDKRMSSILILAAFDIIKAICKAAGYTEQELLVVSCLAEDTAFPLVDFNGDLIEFFGTNPSGHPLTVIVNGLANSLYMRYCYYVLNPNKESKTFKENVNLMTYGDDMIAGVSDAVPWFNHTAIQKVLTDIDVGYTMADKEAESVPYIHIDEATFLKRSWRYDADVGAIVAPLEHDSIEKMLMINVVSKTITREYQALCVADTACREYFWYGKQIFEEKRSMLIEVIHEVGLGELIQNHHFPTWDNLYDQFWAYKKRAPMTGDVPHQETSESKNTVDGHLEDILETLQE